MGSMSFPTEHEVLILKLIARTPDGAFARDLLTSARGRVKQGSIYTTLNRMQDKGFVRTIGSQYHRAYVLTALGKRAIEAAKVLRASA